MSVRDPFPRFRGGAARRAVESLLQQGKSGVVVDVRFSPNTFARIERRGWSTVSVRVGTVSRRFDSTARRRVPLVVEMSPAAVSVRVDASTETPRGVPARLDALTGVSGRCVTVVVVHPPMRGLLLVTHEARLEISSAYLAEDGTLAWNDL